MKNEEKEVTNDLTIPDYVTLHEKYNCVNCKFNKNYGSGIQRICKAHPHNLTDCEKRFGLVKFSFNVITSILVILAFLKIYATTQSIIKTLAYTLVFGVGLDVVCTIIEGLVNWFFSNMEKRRKNEHQEKVDAILAVKEAKKQEEQMQEEAKKEMQKDVKEAKKLFKMLSNDYLGSLKIVVAESRNFSEQKKELYKEFKILLKNLEVLVSHITPESFNISDVKFLFKIYLPMLMQYTNTYIDNTSIGLDTRAQNEQMVRVVKDFNTKISHLKDDMQKSGTEDFVYKLQALGTAVSGKESYKEE